LPRNVLEVADIFRAHRPTLRQQQRGHLSLGQLKVMSAIEQCRSVALGGHALRCSSCAESQIAYNSCRNRHCPKCQSSAAQRWLEARQADLLPVPYYHVVFTLPAPISAIAYTNKEMIYGLLFDIAAETLRTIAADPKHLGARIGTTLVLHTWGSALTHHPHVHGIVPGGGLAPEADRWVPCKPGFFLSVRVLSRLFRRRFLEELENLHREGLQLTARRSGRSRRHLPLEGLPRTWANAPQNHDLGDRGVHAPLPAARAALRLSSHPPLRLARQRQPQARYRRRPRASASTAAHATR
jgi:hypothetical protein